MITSKLNLNKEIISAFSGQQSIVTTPKLYIQITGSHSLAIVLNQCVYWSNKSKLKNGWFYKDYEEWFDEIHMPERSLRRRFERLEEKGFITTKVKKVNGVNVKHIYPHIDKIHESILDLLINNNPNRPNCLDGINNDQNTCTNIAPTGHFGRSRTAKVAGSGQNHSFICTEENKQNINIVDSSNSTPSTNSFCTKKPKDHEKDVRFMRFYAEYPRKEKPKDAHKAFRSVIGQDDELLSEIIADVKKRKEQHSQWSDKKYIPLPATYLRKGDYLSEILNEAHETQVKKDAIKAENEIREKKMEEHSRKLAEEQYKNTLNKHNDQFAHRRIVSKIPEGLELLKKQVGYKKFNSGVA